MATRIQFLRTTSNQWTNYQLAEGELGYETDTGRAKIGTGEHSYNALPYSIVPYGGMGELIARANTSADVRNLLNILPSENVRIVTPSQNLISVYNQAASQALIHDVPRSANNRITIFLKPGTYNLTASLVLSADFIDIIGLGRAEEVIIKRTIEGRNRDYCIIKQEAHDVRLENFTLELKATTGGGWDNGPACYWPPVLNVGGSCEYGNNGTIIKANHGLKFGEMIKLKRVDSDSRHTRKEGPFYYVRDVTPNSFRIALGSPQNDPITDFLDVFHIDGGDMQILETRLFGWCKNIIFTKSADSNPVVNAFRWGSPVGGTFIKCRVLGDFPHGFGGGTGASVTGYFEDCQAGRAAFGCSIGGPSTVVSGTFINCKTGDSSFGYNGSVSGVFINCFATNRSFGHATNTIIEHAIFENCIAHDQSFGHGTNARISHTVFENCFAGSQSFGHGTNVRIDWNTVFENCSAWNQSFGSGADGLVLDTTFENCTAGNGSFGSGDRFQITSNALFKNCKGNDACFGGATAPILQGTFIGCKGGKRCFGGYNYSILSGTFIDCEAGDESLGSPWHGTLSGKFIRCKGGDWCFGPGNGLVSGLFIDCEAGKTSFGVGALKTGHFIRCRGLDGSFHGGSLANGTMEDCTVNVANPSIATTIVIDSNTKILRCFFKNCTYHVPNPSTNNGWMVQCLSASDANPVPNLAERRP